MDIIVIGLGNPLLSDDGVGPAAARLLKEDMSGRVVVDEASVGGMELVEMLLGFQRAVIIDSIRTKDGTAGEIRRLTLDSISSSRNVNNLHNVGLVQAMEMWKELGGSVPDDIVIYAVEARDVHTFSESLTPEVKAALPRVVECVKDEVENWLRHFP